MAEKKREKLRLISKRPLQNAGLLSWITFSWANEFLALCMKRQTEKKDQTEEIVLDDEDVFSLPEKDSASFAAEAFVKSYTVTGGRWMQCAYASVKIPFIIGSLLELSSVGIMVLIPYLVARLVSWLPKVDLLPWWQPYALGILISSLLIVKTHMSNFGITYNAQAASNFTYGMIGALHCKMLRLSEASRQKYSGGAVANLLAVDPMRIFMVILVMPFLITGPIQIVGAIGLLSYHVGWTALAGLGAILLYIPFQYIISKRLDLIREELTKLSDERLKLAQETFAGIRLIKYFGWEPKFISRITKIRTIELAKLRKLLFFTAITVSLAIWLPAFGGALIVGLHAWRTSGSTVLDPGVTYMILTMMMYLIGPVYIIPVFSSMLVAAKVSAGRLSEFLGAPEARSLVSTEGYSDIAVELNNAEFVWETNGEDKKAVSGLAELNLSIQEGSLVAIVGPVASGKSSLLSALTGEIVLTGGTASIHLPKANQRIAYCPQQAWIMTGTIRDNVCFGLPFEQKLYSQVLEESCLGPDIQGLPEKDLSKVGERGTGLSGGQKQRLSLARALYSRSSLYLLDDPLSALDPAVGRNVLHNCILRGSMKDATRLLVTHHVGLLNGLPEGSIDMLIVMDQCRITYAGPFDLSKIKVEAIESHSVPDEEVKPPLAAEEVTCSTPVEASEEKEKNLSVVLPVCTGMNKILLYTRLAGWTLLLVGVLFLATEAVGICQNLYLRSLMMKTTAGRVGVDVFSSMLVYTGLGLLQGILGFGRITIFGGLLANRVARRTHENALRAVCRTTMAFFDQVQVGELLGRFGRDLTSIDMNLPDKVIQCLGGLGAILSSIFMLIFSIASESGSAALVKFLPILLVGFLPILTAIYFIWSYFSAAWSPLQQLVGAKMGGMLGNAGETISGLNSIRNFGATSMFKDRAMEKIDGASRVSVLSLVLSRWIGMRIDVCSSLMVFLTICICIGMRLDAGLAGLLIQYSLTAAFLFSWIITTLVEAGAELNPFDRVAAMSKRLPDESEATTRSVHQVIPPDNWPLTGSIEFRALSLRYRPSLPLVLSELSLAIQPGQKIALVGRTGSGKSSMIAALFRAVAPESGSILIEGRDISEIPLDMLRHRLSIVPQDPILFAGSIRFNLDPESVYTDDMLWRVLEQTRMHSEVQSHPLKLGMPVEEAGSNFSVGQRQLLCLARALLRPSPILVIDEATANVDYETDGKIQAVLREHVNRSGCTLITVAHRISTIVDYDRVAVLAAGRLLEYGSPKELFSKQDSLFREMALKASVSL